MALLARTGESRLAVHALPARAGGRVRTRAMHHSSVVTRIVVVLATVHLEAAVRQGTLEGRRERVERERLQEEDAAQRCGHGHRGARHLEVAGAREDGAAQHDMVCDEGVHSASSGRVEPNSIAIR